jgi:hypothetical protein
VHNTKRTYLALAAFVLLAARCSSSPSTDDGGTDAANGNDGTNGNDSGNGNDTGSGNDTGTPSKPNMGGVYFSESKTQNTTTYVATASFFSVPDGGTASGGCAGTKNGNCCYTPPSMADSGTTGGGTAVSAGGITLKDGTTTMTTMTPTGTTYTAVSDPPTTALTWNAADMLSVSAAGDTVHAFSGSVAAVGLFAGVTPALSVITPTAITRSQDFTITWTAGAGNISLSLSATKNLSTPDGAIVCTAADTGTMTVPTALLTQFSTGDKGFVILTRTASSDASNDNATITISSSTTDEGSATYN